MKLKDRTAVVTGAGRGIGQAISLAFAKEGADVVVASRTISETNETAKLIQELGRSAIAKQADVSKIEDVETLMKSALQEFDKIDILVNNAGIYGPIGPLVANDTNRWIETISVNLVGTFLCCRAVLPSMIDRRKGRIINLSGGGAASSSPRFSAYGCSKAAIVRLTETLAEEVEEYNIQVNAIAPGAVNTRLVTEVLRAGANAGEKMLARTRLQLKTGGTPPELAGTLAVFLASDESNGLTGRLISAEWDDWRNMGARIPEIMNTDMYKLRRIIQPVRVL